MDLEFIRGALLSTTTPDGQRVRLPPPAVRTDWLDEQHGDVPLPPAYGEHTDAVLAEIGGGLEQVSALRERGVVA